MASEDKRQLNFELLRIVSMVMIVCLHYLGKGGILGSSSDSYMTATRYVAWLIEAFCLVSVNVYVLISGYFGVSVGKKENGNILKRPIRIWKQVIFYSAVIGIMAIVIGLQEFDIYQIFNYIFPIVTEHYWFATSYIFLCLFMPFLNEGVNTIEKKQLGNIIGVMLILFSIAKTIIPMHLPWDKSGYDVLWFVTLYLTGAYIRKYGLPIMDRKRLPIILYIINTLVIFASFVVIRLIYLKTGKLGDFISYGYSYNYIFCYIGAICFFLAFGRLNTKNFENFRKPIELISSATFGVYLIHEHINIRYLWPTWFNTKNHATLSVLAFLISMICTVLSVYMVCTLIEIIRYTISRLITEKVGKGRNK